MIWHRIKFTFWLIVLIVAIALLELFGIDDPNDCQS